MHRRPYFFCGSESSYTRYEQRVRSTSSATKQRQNTEKQACERHTYENINDNAHCRTKRVTARNMESKRATTLMKQRIVTLHADNSNQEEWISSVRTEQRMNNIMHLAVKGMSKHRCLETADLIASAEASSKAASSKDDSNIKDEAEQEGA